MKKKEIIWRYLLIQATEIKQLQFQQKDIAQYFGYSLSTVFNSLKVPRQTGTIKVTGRYFVIENIEKLLNIWATNRQFSQDIIYSTRVNVPTAQIEAQITSGAMYGAYSAYFRQYGDAPADYDKVYVYLPESRLAELKTRFPARKGEPNLIVLSPDEELVKISQNGVTPLVQTYIDIWNLSDWFAKDFLRVIREKLNI